MDHLEQFIKESQVKLDRSEHKFKLLFELSPIGMAMVDQETGEFLEVNDALLSSTGYTKEEFLALSFWDITPREYEAQEQKQLEDLRTFGRFGPNQKEYIKKDGTRYPIKISGFSLVDIDGRRLVWGLIEDITELKQHEMIYTDNKELLEYVAIEKSLQKVLDKIVAFSEKRVPETKCSILILDDEKKHLLNGSAPSLPQFYNDAIHGVEIGEKVGSCGSAAFKKERVIIENIDEHENWQPYLALTQPANLHACWSEPIISSSNEVLGTFAMYNEVPKGPSEFELKLIETYANIAAKAIEKHHYTRKINESKEELRENQNLLKNIIETIPDLIWLKDVNGVYITCNTEFELFFGAKEEEIIGKTDYDFVPEELADFFRKHDKNAMNSNTTLLNEEWVTYATDKRHVLLDTSKKAMYDNKGNLIGVLGIGHDVTQRKLKEDKLRDLNDLAQMLTESQRVLLSLFDKGENLLFKWKNDEQHTIEYVSQSVENLIGLKAKDFIFDNNIYSDFIHPDDKERVLAICNKSLSDKVDYFKYEPYRILTVDGEEKWVLEYTATQKNSEGEITHFISYISDITEQVSNQEIIFHQSKIAAIGEMLGNISHQWRQPLSVISTIATGLKMKQEFGSLSPEELVKNLNMVNNHAQYLSNTIDDFRNFFLADCQTKNEVNLKDVFEKVESLISDAFKSSNIELIETIDDMYIITNQNILIQALLNIFNNARDALDEKQPKEKFVFISLLEDATNYFIKIKDNAGGIAEKNIEKIFEPYFTTKHQSQGTGIGLYMTNQIISKHLKGKILVSNESYIHDNIECYGACFTIKIPK